MVRQGFDFVALVFALFKMGAVPVLIDPGMGVNRLLDCIRTVNLDAFVGVPLAHVVRTLRPAPFQSIERGRFVTVGRRWLWGGPTLAALTQGVSDKFEPAPTAATETAAILFTSGSTGPAKGVVYEHGMFDAQVRMIQSTYGIERGEIDLPTFPLFALFSVAMGMTIVLPDMDPAHPARVNPSNIVDAIRDQKVTNTFGSPALWARVAAYCVERGITLPTLRRILIAGAPVPPAVIEQLHQVLSPEADVHTPYGATESLPVSTISGREVVGRNAETPKSRNAETELQPIGIGTPEGRTTVARDLSPWNKDLNTPASGGRTSDSSALRAEMEEESLHQGLKAPGNHRSPSGREVTVAGTLAGAGTCVGRPVDGAEVRIIRISDDPIPKWSDELSVPSGEIGEISVRGEAVTREYFNLPVANAASKIKDGDTVWHRIGDVGYFDELGCLWFCGRKAHRVQMADGTLFTECIEPQFHQHPSVARCALVGVGPAGRQTPILIVEPKSGVYPRRRRTRDQLARDIMESVSHNRQSEVSAFRRFRVSEFPILFHRKLPVDIRHNAKINRELLAAWAARRLNAVR